MSCNLKTASGDGNLSERLPPYLMLGEHLSFTCRTKSAGLANMTEQPPDAMRAVIKETLQRVIDDLLFYSDEMEMHRLPSRDGASALRLAAGLFALTKQMV